MKHQQARNYRKGRRKPVRLVVLHTMECPEQLDTAERVASWFAGDSAPKASAHYCVDADTVVRCVKEEDTAWHAKGGDVNDRSVGVELAGYARQTSKQWYDPYSKVLLERAGNLVAGICGRHGIPVRFVPSDRLLAGDAGITTHAEVTKAYGVVGGHTDPGKDFPIDNFILVVDSYVAYPEPDADE